MKIEKAELKHLLGFVEGVFGMSLHNFAALFSDNCSSNHFTTTILMKQLLRCSSHRFNIISSKNVFEEDDILQYFKL